ncbi:MAG: hypothetical protein IPO35_01365 [Uliginosibacterium sp.]|nr:hypothetical protein [Uliginosibacterium sp.]
MGVSREDGNKLSLIVVMNTSTAARRLPLKLDGWKFAKGEWFDQTIVDNEARLRKLKKGATATLPGRTMARLEFVAK